MTFSCSFDKSGPANVYYRLSIIVTHNSAISKKLALAENRLQSIDQTVGEVLKIFLCRRPHFATHHGIKLQLNFWRISTIF